MLRSAAKAPCAETVRSPSAAIVFRNDILLSPYYALIRGQISSAQRILAVLVENNNACAIYAEPDGLVGLDGPWMLHARYDLGAAEIGEQQALVAEHLGETDGRGEISAEFRPGAVAFRHDILRTDA